MSRQLSYARLDKPRTQDQTSANGSIIGALNWNYSYNVDKQVTAENTLGSFLSTSSFAASYDPGDRLVNWNRSASPVGGARQTEAWTMPSVPSRHKQSPFLLRKGTLKRAEILSPVVDDAGNHNSVTRDGTTQNRTHNSDNELVSIAGDTTTRDAKGNTTEDAQGNKYFYDLDNRIYEIRMDNGDKIELQYDALGRRVFRKQGSDETAFLWWGDQETSEHESKAGQPVIQNDLWVHPTALNKIIARAVEGDENDIEYYHKNYLDHVYAVSDDNGNIEEHYRYSAFGEVEIYSPAGIKLADSAIGNTVLWNSRRFDFDTNLYYYKYRHYKADYGRWLGRDPIEEDGGINLYNFVDNNPIDKWDQLGLSWLDEPGWDPSEWPHGFPEELMPEYDPLHPPNRASASRGPQPIEWGMIISDGFVDEQEEGADECCKCDTSHKRTHLSIPQGINGIFITPGQSGTQCPVGLVVRMAYERNCLPTVEGHNCKEKKCYFIITWICRADPDRKGISRWGTAAGSFGTKYN